LKEKVPSSPLKVYPVDIDAAENIYVNLMA